MARQFKGKLSKEDVEYLQSRHSEQYVDYMIGLHGEKGGSTAEEPDEGTEAQDTGGDAGDGAEEGGEDLIGTPEPSDLPVFDSLAATEAEVKSYIESLDADRVQVEKDRILELENSREDREPRKGVVNLAS
jgi:hypothetical protein